MGFNAGQIGDILIGLPTAKYLHDNVSDIDITLCINKKFSKIAPFLVGLEHVNDIYFSDGYETFPSNVDKDYLMIKHFDKIYNPMQTHSRYDWYNYYHYTEELAISHNVIFPNEIKQFNRKINLNKLYSINYDNCIGFAPYADGPDRSISKEDAQFIVDIVNKNNFKLIFLGLNNNLPNMYVLDDNSFLNAGIALSNLKGLITVDTAWSWLASGYNINTFGLYYKNYPDMIKQWSHFPENPNAKYIINDNIKCLDRQMIEQDLIDWIKNI